jgi:GNAT superfamily N-acetyltransferase
MKNMAAADCLPRFLPGTIDIERGTIEDFRELEQFHYAPGRPATWAGIWRVKYVDGGLWMVDGDKGPRGCVLNHPLSTIHYPRFSPARVIAVGVLSYPTPSHRTRDRVLGLSGPRYGQKLAFVNRHVRTISRVIVHPQFRSLGIASALVRRICEDCPVRYVEAIAAMGEVHPFFEKAGMKRVGEGYFIFDRERGV